jgi:hypothetical protein
MFNGMSYLPQRLMVAGVCMPSRWAGQLLRLRLHHSRGLLVEQVEPSGFLSELCSVGVGPDLRPRVQRGFRQVELGRSPGGGLWERRGADLALRPMNQQLIYRPLSVTAEGEEGAGEAVPVDAVIRQLRGLWSGLYGSHGETRGDVSGPLMPYWASLKELFFFS